MNPVFIFMAGYVAGGASLYGLAYLLYRADSRRRRRLGLPEVA